MCEECEQLRLDVFIAWLCRDWNEMWRLIRVRERHKEDHDLWKELWPEASVCAQTFWNANSAN